MKKNILMNNTNDPTYMSWVYEGRVVFVDLFYGDGSWDAPAKKGCVLIYAQSDFQNRVLGDYTPLMVSFDRYKNGRTLIYFWDDVTESWESRGMKASIWPEKWEDSDLKKLFVK